MTIDGPRMRDNILRREREILSRRDNLLRNNINLPSLNQLPIFNSSYNISNLDRITDLPPILKNTYNNQANTSYNQDNNNKQ
jgi:hypothetical protein